MMKRASADKPTAATSCSERLTIERRLSSSALVGETRLTVLSASSLDQLILISKYDESGLGKYLRQKVILHRALFGEFDRGINRRIHLATQRFPRSTQR